MTALDAVVAISISEPADRELAPRGLAIDHVNHTYIELARQILAVGGSLAYGGNPLASEPNYLDILAALLRTYAKPDRPPRERIHIYLAAPISDKLNQADRGRLVSLMTLIDVPRLPGEPEPAGDFTAMREAMLAGTDARIVLGGKLHGYAGRWPGIVEEAYLTLRAGEPLYVVGGLGGAAALVVDLVRGNERPDVQLRDGHILTDEFRGADPRNGLTPQENEMLFETADLDLVVALIMRGLHARDHS